MPARPSKVTYINFDDPLFTPTGCIIANASSDPEPSQGSGFQRISKNQAMTNTMSIRTSTDLPVLLGIYFDHSNILEIDTWYHKVYITTAHHALLRTSDFAMSLTLGNEHPIDTSPTGNFIKMVWEASEITPDTWHSLEWRFDHSTTTTQGNWKPRDTHDYEFAFFTEAAANLIIVNLDDMFKNTPQHVWRAENYLKNLSIVSLDEFPTDLYQGRYLGAFTDATSSPLHQSGFNSAIIPGLAASDANTVKIKNFVDYRITWTPELVIPTT